MIIAALDNYCKKFNTQHTIFKELHFRVLQTYVVNFISQKVQHFQADSEYLGKINTKKENSNFFLNV